MKSLLKQADDDLKRALFSAGRRKRFEPEEAVFSEGESASFLPIIISGSVKMVRCPEPGKEIIVGIFREGEMFAVPPVFDGRNYPSTAIAMDRSELLLIAREKVLDIARGSGAFSLIVIEWMCEMLREKTAAIQTLTTSSPEHRIVDVILRMTERDGTVFPFQVPVRRQDLAEMAGITTETAIRSVKKLAERGVLKIVKGKIVIPESRSLRAFVT